MKKKIIVTIIIVALTVLCLDILTRLLTPKYMHGIVEGALIKEYYDEKSPHDVIFIGDCEVYENFSPITLWEEYGITSYIRGSAQQLIWQSYYLLKDALRYEKPKAVVFNVLSLKFDEPQKEAYNRMTLDGMRWSKDKVDAINASMTDDEEFIEYLFPILRYHSRWSDLEQDDITYLNKRDKISHSGYYMRTDIKAADSLPDEKRLANYTFGENAVGYLEKIRTLCEEENIELILIKAPSLFPAWYDEWDEQVQKYADEHNLKYYNFLRNYEDIGIDFSTDTYDGGLHLNVYGAEKLSRYFGQILRDEAGMPDHRGEEPFEAVYREKAEYYYAKKAEGTIPVTKSNQEETKTELQLPAEKKSGGYFFMYNNTEIRPNDDAAPIIEKLGEPNDYSETTSCAFEGLDKTFSYDGFDLYTYPDEDRDYVNSIYFTDDTVSTAEGIRFGSTEEEMLTAYGDEYEEEFGAYTFTQGDTRLLIMITDGIVDYIEYQAITE